MRAYVYIDMYKYGMLSKDKEIVTWNSQIYPVLQEKRPDVPQNDVQSHFVSR